MNAKYKCIKCNFEFEGSPGPTTCYKCGSLYVRWENYDKWREYVMKIKYGNKY